VLTSLGSRIAIRQDAGFTLIELLIVLIILANLIAIAVPAYLTFEGKAQKAAAQANVRDAVPAVIAYGNDNVGAASDVDSSASTAGYAGMTLPLLQTYDARVKNIRIKTVSTAGYCIDSTVGAYAYAKPGPSAAIVFGVCP
jgi:prepilin-type N-terminal cleavage/methylation domain-containing protein